MYDNGALAVFAQNYFAKIARLAPDLYHLTRTDSYPQGAEIVDCLGCNWMLALPQIEPDKVFVGSGMDFLQFERPMAVYMPAFNLVRYHFQPVVFEWDGYVSSTPPPPEFPAQPVIFDWDETLPTSREDVYAMITNRRNSVTLNSERQPSALAKRVKLYIDTHFSEDLKINDLATIFDCSRVVLSRDFSRTYGLSPVKYRHRLRIFEAMRLMDEGKSITTAFFESGFSGSTEFVHQFKKTLGTRPSSYRWRE